MLRKTEWFLEWSRTFALMKNFLKTTIWRKDEMRITS